MSSIAALQKLAQELHEVRSIIISTKEGLRPLEEKEVALREQMIGALHLARLKSYRGEDGVSYARSFRSGLEVVDETAALGWARVNNCLRVDTRAAQKILQGAGALPPCFEYTETELLRITQPKEE